MTGADSPERALALARWENEGGRPQSTSGMAQSSPRTNAPTGPTRQSHIRVGRVYDERGPRDQLRVLVDRLWPRGLSKTRADLDEWCKTIAPSASLRIWYGHDPARFTEFERRYRQELHQPERGGVLRHLHELTRTRTVILLTAARNPEISEAAVLARVLHTEEQTDP